MLWTSQYILTSPFTNPTKNTISSIFAGLLPEDDNEKKNPHNCLALRYAIKSNRLDALRAWCVLISPKLNHLRKIGISLIHRKQLVLTVGMDQWPREVLMDDPWFYLGFYVAFNTVQVISRRVVGRAEETST